MRFLVARSDLHQTRWAPDPDSPDVRPLADGELRLRIDQFALTANNITYAAFGDAMKYWQFFPSGDEGFGCIPAWGFADVVESRCAGVDTGQRVYGYLPMGDYLVVRPERAPGRPQFGANRRSRWLAVRPRPARSRSRPRGPARA